MAEVDNSKDASKGMQNGAFWGSLVGAVGGLVNSFNYRAQENEIEVARLNAEAARANAGAYNVPVVGSVDKNYVNAGVALVVVVVLVLIFKKN